MIDLSDPVVRMVARMKKAGWSDDSFDSSRRSAVPIPYEPLPPIVRACDRWGTPTSPVADLSCLCPMCTGVREAKYKK